MKTRAVLLALAVLAVAAPPPQPRPGTALHRARQPGCASCRSPRTRSRSPGTRRTDNSGKIHAYIAGGIYHPGNSTTKTFTGLVPNWTQTYRVQAMDPSGNTSALSAPCTVTTAPDRTAPTTPSNLRVTGTGISTVSLAWDRSSDRWSFSYEVLMDGSVARLGRAAVRRTPFTTLRTDRARHPHRCDRSARATSRATSRALSNPVTVTLAGERRHARRPSAPSNLTVEDLNDNCGSQILRWTGSTDNTDPPSSIEYELYRNDRFWTLSPPGTTESFQYTPPGVGTWHVVAVDRAGNSSPPSNAGDSHDRRRREPLLT